MTSLRSLVTEALTRERLLLTDQKHETIRREAYAAGVELLPRALSSDSRSTLRELGRSLGLAEPVLPRLLGFGWQQADGLAALAGTPKFARANVAHAGALFNLGIALFDHVADRFPAKAVRLLNLVTPDFLNEQLAGGAGRLPSNADDPIELLVTLIVEFFKRAGALGGDAPQRRALNRTILAMYAAERFVSATRRADGAASLDVWRQLRRKSAVPLILMAHLALLPEPRGTEERRAAARRAAALAGEAIWIVDDLADIREDWDAEGWSRPLWLLARCGKRVPRNADAALRQVVDFQIAAAEVHRLVMSLARLRDLSEDIGPEFVRSIQACVHSWIELLPG